MALIKCYECGAQISKTAKSCPHCGAPKKKTSAVTWGVTLFLVFMFMFVIANESGKLSDERTDTKSPKEQAMENLDLDFSWSTEGFGNVMEANFIIKNKGLNDVKDIEIECIHTAKSGTQIDKNTRVIYELFKRKSTKKVKKFNMGFINTQAYKTSCRIKDIVIIE